MCGGRPSPGPGCATPARSGHRCSWVPAGAFMTSAPAAYEDQSSDLAPGTFESVRTHAQLGAPALRDLGGWPVLLFSPGLGNSRSLYTTLSEDLASQGFAVAAIDHPHD